MASSAFESIGTFDASSHLRTETNDLLLDLLVIVDADIRQDPPMATARRRIVSPRAVETMKTRLTEFGRLIFFETISAQRAAGTLGAAMPRREPPAQKSPVITVLAIVLILQATFIAYLFLDLE